MDTALLIVVAALVVVLVAAIVVYNRFVRLRTQAEEGWAQIDVQLQRRHDLIPNLVNTARGYADHERDTLEAVIQARNAAVAADGPAQTAEAENVLTGMLRQFFALSESYPELKASTNFLQLQRELAHTENRIAYARQFYNTTVRQFNTLRASFPAVLIATVMGYTDLAFFELDDAQARSVPDVAF